MQRIHTRATLAILPLFFFWLTPAEASVLFVTHTNDDGTGSLRAALAAASAGDTIAFALPASLQTLTLDSELIIKRSIAIVGPGAALLRIVRNPAVAQMRLFTVDTGIDATISGLSIENGSATSGGGIEHLGGQLTLSGVVFRGNRASGAGGALHVVPAASSVRIVSSRFESNEGLLGAGVAIADGTSSAFVEGCDFDGNSATLAGGGLYFGGTTLRVTGSTFNGNSSAGGPAGGGGGIYVGAGAGTTLIQDSSFTENLASGFPSFGGGVAAIQLGSDDFRVERSLFAANTAQLGAGLCLGQSGAHAHILTSTFYSNNGPALEMFAAGSGAPSILYVAASTFAANTGAAVALTEQGGPSVTGIFRNNLLSGSGQTRAGVGDFVSVGHNLTSDAAFLGDHDIGNVDPLLGELADNGGPTRTMALASGSPAIDAGECAAYLPVSERLTVDQRGMARDGACDIGAFEWVAAAPSGAAGPTGANGATGPTGANGATGPIGANGATGPIGANGITGLDGAPGAQGSSGPTGPTGQADPLASLPIVDVIDAPDGTCADGGLALLMGRDDDKDGTLSSAEVDSVRYVCSASATPKRGGCRAQPSTQSSLVLVVFVLLPRLFRARWRRR
jgi:Collagen triple helix repeat (20 copies)/Right handed beta helix region